MPIEVLGTDHIDLTVTDVVRSRAFYDKVLAELGFRRIQDEHNINWANAHVSVGIYAAVPGEKGATHTRRRAGFHHLALRAKAREDVDRFHEFLVREGVTVLDPRRVSAVRPGLLRGVLRGSRRDEARARALPLGVLAQGHDGGEGRAASVRGEVRGAAGSASGMYCDARRLTCGRRRASSRTDARFVDEAWDWRRC